MLSARIYGAGHDGLMPAICLPGLTRNARDFHELALYLSRDAQTPRKVVVFDYRGRGRSDYDQDWHNYNVAVEARDVAAGLVALGLENCAFIGTSRGAPIEITCFNKFEWYSNNLNHLISASVQSLDNEAWTKGWPDYKERSVSQEIYVENFYWVQTWLSNHGLFILKKISIFFVVILLLIFNLKRLIKILILKILIKILFMTIY